MASESDLKKVNPPSFHNTGHWCQYLSACEKNRVQKMFSKAAVEAKTDFLCLDSVRLLLTTYTLCVDPIFAQYRFSSFNSALNVKKQIVCIIAPPHNVQYQYNKVMTIITVQKSHCNIHSKLSEPAIPKSRKNNLYLW